MGLVVFVFFYAVVLSEVVDVAGEHDYVASEIYCTENENEKLLLSSD